MQDGNRSARRKIIRYPAVVAIALGPIAASSHHSFFGRFDAETIIEIEGRVTEVHWRNPHATVLIETSDENGEPVSWVYEALSPNQLQRSGIQQDTIKIGDRVRAAGWPPLTEKKEMFATNLLLPSGDELLLVAGAQPIWTDSGSNDTSYRTQTEGDPSRPELGLFRVWSHTDVIPFLFPGTTDPTFDVYSYPLTAAGRTAVERFDGATQNPTRGCVPKGMPLIMEQPFPMEFVEAGSDILLRIEEYDLVRSIHLDGRPPAADQPRSLLGYSLGRWDDSTLIVTTTHIDWPWFNQLGIPQSDASVVIERFTPTDDGSRLDYTLTVNDPVIFTEPVTLEKFWLYLPNQRIERYDCVASD